MRLLPSPSDRLPGRRVPWMPLVSRPCSMGGRPFDGGRVLMPYSPEKRAWRMSFMSKHGRWPTSAEMNGDVPGDVPPGNVPSRITTGKAPVPPQPPKERKEAPTMPSRNVPELPELSPGDHLGNLVLRLKIPEFWKKKGA